MENQFTTPQDDEALDAGPVEITFADIRSVIDAFYTQVSTDPVLSVPFASVGDWPHHIVKLTHFWWLRFGGRPYLKGVYNPVEKHFLAGFNDVFLKRWLELFEATLEQKLTPQKAAVWRELARRMGEALTVKNDLYRAHVESRS